jgi:rhamnogalacturonyl hydrolase YesR
MRLGTSGIDFGQPRSIGHGSFGFYAAWEATGEQKYRDAWRKFCQGTANRIDRGRKMGSGAWQRGMAMQGLAWYVEITGDESVVPALEKALERDFNSGSDETAYAKVFFWKRTRDPKYFHAAARFIGGKPERSWMQRFGNHGRSRLYTPWIVMQGVEPKPLPPK